MNTLTSPHPSTTTRAAGADASSAGSGSGQSDALKPDGSSYGQILKSSAVVGGASVLTILIGIVRTKALAMMLGPAGFGLMGAFMAIVDLVSSVAGMGINRSGVRQIAEATGTGDGRRIAVTVVVLRRVTLVLGIVGAGLLAALALPVTEFSFGSDGYVAAVSLLALAVLFKLVAEGQSALLQGMRRIADFAKVGVIGAAAGTAVAVPLVYFLRESGVALSIVVVAAMTAVTAWWYSRKVVVERVRLSGVEFRNETKLLLQLGLAFMVSGLLMMGAAYVVRVFLLRHEGLEAAGLFQAAWTLGGMYVGLILQAMGADFYPRLVAAAQDHVIMNRLVNEQAQVSLLLASVGVLATLVLAPFVLVLFYSDGFVEATEALRWICLGMTLRVITWPMGYIIVAKGDQRQFIFVEVAWTLVNIGLSYFAIVHFGVAGAGIAFFLSYVFHGVLVYALVHRLTGFRFDRVASRIILLCSLLTALTLAAVLLLPSGPALFFGLFGVALAAATSVRKLLGLFSRDTAPRYLRWLFTALRVST